MGLVNVRFFQDDVCIEIEGETKHCRLIAVHAGLEKDKDVKQQLEFLKARDTRVPKIEALSGRKNVWNIPEVMALYLLISADNRVFCYGWWITNSMQLYYVVVNQLHIRECALKCAFLLMLIREKALDITNPLLVKLSRFRVPRFFYSMSFLYLFLIKIFNFVG